MGVKRNTRHRIWLAWMLLMTFMPLSVVKVFHNHSEETSITCTDAHSGKSHHTCETCPICQFMLSPFIETPSTLLTYTPLYDGRVELFRIKSFLSLSIRIIFADLLLFFIISFKLRRQTGFNLPFVFLLCFI